MDDAPRTFYFALTRFLARQHDAGELSQTEARAGGVILFAITYSFLAAPLVRSISTTRVVALVLVIPIAAFLIWPVIIYLNAFLIRAARGLGLLNDDVPTRDAQHYLFCLWLSVFALSLCTSGTYLRLAGQLWFALLALNVAAATALWFRNERRA